MIRDLFSRRPAARRICLPEQLRHQSNSDDFFAPSKAVVAKPHLPGVHAINSHACCGSKPRPKHWGDPAPPDGPRDFGGGPSRKGQNNAVAGRQSSGPPRSRQPAGFFSSHHGHMAGLITKEQFGKHSPQEDRRTRRARTSCRTRPTGWPNVELEMPGPTTNKLNSQHQNLQLLNSVKPSWPPVHLSSLGIKLAADPTTRLETARRWSRKKMED